MQLRETRLQRKLEVFSKCSHHCMQKQETQWDIFKYWWYILKIKLFFPLYFSTILFTTGEQGFSELFLTQDCDY